MLPPYITGARPLAVYPAAGVSLDQSFLAGREAVPGQIAPTSSDADLITALYAGPDGVPWSGGIGRQRNPEYLITTSHNPLQEHAAGTLPVRDNILNDDCR